VTHTNLQLKGSLVDSAPLKECFDCKQPASQRGGCDMKRGWICAACWKTWWKARNGR
jgi:hypothetical protein